MMRYEEFLKSKLITTVPSGFDVNVNELHPKLYPFQRDIIRWGLKRGKACNFTMTGTGKTPMQTVWADAVSKYDGHGAVLMLAPLAVSKQTAYQMGEKFNIDIRLVAGQKDIGPGLNITNYEKLHHFRPDGLVGIVCDESGIIKNLAGKTRNQIIDFVQTIPFRLFASATPSPNDETEIGNHVEALGVMSMTEMLSTFFVHDGGDTSKWRLKGHAKNDFWRFLASIAVFLNTPSDLGYSDEGFIIPPLNTIQYVVASEPLSGELYQTEARTLRERQLARRFSIKPRCELAVEIAKQSSGPFMFWCNLNEESDTLKKMMPNAVEVKGSDTEKHKEWAMLEFGKGNIDYMISKPSICGHGMNWQVCHETAFVGLSDSFEDIFQATKRFHRHGQIHPVNRHLVISQAEGAVLKNVRRKEKAFMDMIGEMVKHTAAITSENIKNLHIEKIEYNPFMPIQFPSWLQGAHSGI